MVTGRGGNRCGCEALALHCRHLGLCRCKEQHSLGSMRKKSKTLPREVSLPKATSSLGQMLSSRKNEYLYSLEVDILNRTTDRTSRVYSLEDHGSHNCMKSLKSMCYQKTCVSHTVLHLEPSSMGRCPPPGRPERADRRPSVQSEKPVVKSHIANRK